MIVNLLNDASQKSIPKVITKSLAGEGFEPMCITRPERTRAYVKIEDGCECRCTYCAIADARGPVRSKPAEDVIREVEGLYASGTREIVLTGIETGSYGADFEEDYDLGDLIAELDSRGSCERIRLGSLAPELIGERFISKVKNTKILAPHFHLSMQSGSDSVLRGMKRRYNTEMALRNMEIIRGAFPTATFTTDLMVGFPGESEEDFLQTVDFVKRARFLDCHVFAYSKRAGTPAAEYKNQVPEAEKRRRSEVLIAEKNKVRDKVLAEICEREKPLSCIFETREGSVWTAHSDTFAEVRVESEEELSGRLISVMPKYAKDGIIFGELVK
jgi:threonylcarbamoyladenosine tRNA methylthiotransferase MtaB